MSKGIAKLFEETEREMTEVERRMWAIELADTRARAGATAGALVKYADEILAYVENGEKAGKASAQTGKAVKPTEIVAERLVPRQQADDGGYAL